MYHGRYGDRGSNQDSRLERGGYSSSGGILGQGPNERRLGDNLNERDRGMFSSRSGYGSGSGGSGGDMSSSYDRDRRELGGEGYNLPEQTRPQRRSGDFFSDRPSRSDDFEKSRSYSDSSRDKSFTSPSNSGRYASSSSDRYPSDFGMDFSRDLPSLMTEMAGAFPELGDTSVRPSELTENLAAKVQLQKAILAEQALLLEMERNKLMMSGPQQGGFNGGNRQRQEQRMGRQRDGPGQRRMSQGEDRGRFQGDRGGRGGRNQRGGGHLGGSQGGRGGRRDGQNQREPQKRKMDFSPGNQDRNRNMSGGRGRGGNQGSGGRNNQFSSPPPNKRQAMDAQDRAEDMYARRNQNRPVRGGGNRGSRGGNRGSRGGNRPPHGGNRGPPEHFRSPQGGSRGPPGANRSPQGGNRGPQWGNRGPLGGNRGPPGGNRGPPGGNRGPPSRGAMGGHRGLHNRGGGNVQGRGGGMNQDQLFCHVCLYQCKTMNAYKHHMYSNQHLQSIKDFQVVEKEVDLSKKQGKESKEGDDTKEDERLKTYQAKYCTLCKEFISNNLMTHVKTEKHKEMKEKTKPRCEACDMKFQTIGTYIRHCKMDDHKKKVAEHDKKKEGKKEKKNKEELEANNSEADKSTRSVDDTEKKAADEPADSSAPKTLGEDESAMETGQSLTTPSDQAPKEPEAVQIGSGASLKAKPRSKSVDEEPEEDLSVFNPNISVGVQYVVPVTGFFCKLCRRFYTNEASAWVTHCRTESHYKQVKAKRAQIAAAMEKRKQAGSPVLSQEGDKPQSTEEAPDKEETTAAPAKEETVAETTPAEEDEQTTEVEPMEQDQAAAENQDQVQEEGEEEEEEVTEEQVEEEEEEAAEEDQPEPEEEAEGGEVEEEEEVEEEVEEGGQEDDDIEFVQVDEVAGENDDDDEGTAEEVVEVEAGGVEEGEGAEEEEEKMVEAPAKKQQSPRGRRKRASTRKR